MRIKIKLIIVAILFIFSFLNLSLFPYAGHSGDITTQQNWGNVAFEKGLPALYLEGITDYAPFYLYVLKFNAFLQHTLFGNTDAGQSSYVIISKIVPTIANLLIGILIYLYFRKRDYKLATLAMSIYLLNLAVIYNTAYWGQVDSFSALLIMISIILLLNEHYLFSSIFLTLAVITKVQSAFLIPIFAVIILKNTRIKEWLKIIIINLATLCIVLLPHILKKAQLNMARVMLNAVTRTDFITCSAFNLWYLIDPQTFFGAEMRDDVIIGGVSLHMIGSTIFIAYVLLVVYQLFHKTDNDNIIWAASCTCLAFFMLPTRIHERYLFYFFTIFILIAIKNWRYILTYFVLMITHLFNLMMVAHYGGSQDTIYYPIQLILDGLINTFSYINVAVAIASIQLIALVYLGWIGIFKGLSKNLKKDFWHVKRRIFAAH